MTALQRRLEFYLIRHTSSPISKSSKLYKLSPYLDSDGILRIEGRIDNFACTETSVLRPIILSRDHTVTKLIVKYVHMKFHHQANETVLNELRQKFVIPRIRQVLNSIKRNCQACKNRRAMPQPPQMAVLPKSRLAAFTRPFTYVGVDYFGPMTVSVGRRNEKRWGVIFTCLTVRAIHLEIAHSLTTDSCIMAIRNFISRRGIPKVIYSDNGTNFHGAETELKKAFMSMNKDELKSAFTTPETEWIFNPLASSHMGGCWERMIASVLTKSHQKEIRMMNY